MPNAVMKWALLVLVIGLLAGGYVWANGIPGAAQGRGEQSEIPGLAGDVAESSANVPDPKPGQLKVVLEDLGMAGPLCRAAVSSKLDRTPGVIAYSVDLSTDSAIVLYDPDQVTVEGLKQVVADAGYKVRGVREIEE